MDLKVKSGFKVGVHFGTVAVFRDGSGSPIFLCEAIKSTGLIKLVSVNGLRHKTLAKGSQQEIQAKIDDTLAFR